MDNAEILKNIIEARRSVFPRDYSEARVPQEIIGEVLNSAKFAPSHKKTKPWRLRLFQAAEKLALGEELAKIYRETTPPHQFLEKKYADISQKIAKTDTIITISVNFSGLVPAWEEIAATAMAVQNMYLTCAAHGIGCYWSSPHSIQHLDGFLGLEENQKCYGLFYMGMKNSDE